jgi:hypothetical protein
MRVGSNGYVDTSEVGKMHQIVVVVGDYAH